MKILVWEYALWYGRKCLDYLLDGYLMTRFLIRSLTEIPDINIIVFRNREIKVSFQEFHGKVIEVTDTELHNLAKFSEDCDGAFVIAPSIEIMKIAKHLRCRLYGPDITIIPTLSRKDLTLNLLQRKGFPVPEFLILRDRYDVEEAIKELGLPMVMKVVDSAGCYGVHVVNSVNECLNVFEKLYNISNVGPIIAMRYVRGLSMSYSAVVYDGKPVLELVNRQVIKAEGYFFKFYGIESSVKYLRRYILDICRELVQEFSRFLKCYINIDFIVDKDGSVYILEVNPRISISFVNMLYTYGFRSVAEAMLFGHVSSSRREPILKYVSVCRVKASSGPVVDYVSIPEVSGSYFVQVQ